MESARSVTDPPGCAGDRRGVLGPADVRALGVPSHVAAAGRRAEGQSAHGLHMRHSLALARHPLPHTGTSLSVSEVCVASRIGHEWAGSEVVLDGSVSTAQLAVVIARSTGLNDLLEFWASVTNWAKIFPFQHYLVKHLVTYIGNFIHKVYVRLFIA